MGSEKAPWHLTHRSEFAKQRRAGKGQRGRRLQIKHRAAPNPLCPCGFGKAQKRQVSEVCRDSAEKVDGAHQRTLKHHCLTGRAVIPASLKPLNLDA